SGPRPDYFHMGYAVGQWVKVNGAGVAGAPLFAKITAIGNPLIVDTAASTTVTGARINYGASIVDGTTEWIEYLYNVINNQQGLPVQIISNNYLPYGRLGLFLTSDKAFTITNNVFTRSDWIAPNEFTKSGDNKPFP